MQHAFQIHTENALIAQADRLEFDTDNNRIVAKYDVFDGKPGTILISEALKPRPRTDIFHEVRVDWPSLINAANQIGRAITFNPMHSNSDQAQGKRKLSSRELKELKDEFERFSKSMKQERGKYPTRDEADKWASTKGIPRDIVREWRAELQLSERRGRG